MQYSITEKSTITDASVDLSSLDRAILDLLQWEFPLLARPFQEIGRRLEIPEELVLAKVETLCDLGVIRQISAIFDTRRLGYQSCLAAASVPDTLLPELVQTVNRHPGVSHNYQRTGPFNLWFTIATPAGIAPADEVQALLERYPRVHWRLFPSLKVFKIGMRLDMSGRAGSAKQHRRNLPEGTRALTEWDIACIREMQNDIPLCEEPFLESASRLGVSVEEYLQEYRRLEEEGFSRRFAAILRHRLAGFQANGMVCWIAPEEQIERLGQQFASNPNVSHCYQRPTWPDWPYNLFTMVHAGSDEELAALVHAMAKQAGDTPHAIMHSIQEFKKERVRYFESIPTDLQSLPRVLRRVVSVGLSHKTAPTHVREQTAVMCTQKGACSQDLLAQMQAGIILSTCNRTEVYSVEPPEHPGGPETLKRLLSDWSEMDLQSDRACLESRRGLEAVRHLFRVASGLESMALGEPEILGQIRRIKENARQRKWSNPTLDRIFQQAIRVGRRVRAETGIGKGAASLPAAAAGVILERAQDTRLEGCLILGSGDAALRIARALKAKRLPGITLCGRKSERAAVLAEEMGIESLPWPSLNGQVSRFQVIVGATIAEVPVLSVGQVAEDTLLVDLGIPRNFHPNLKAQPGVTLYDLDDLKELVEDSNAARQQYIPDAEAIIDEELCHLTQWFRAKEKG